MTVVVHLLLQTTGIVTCRNGNNDGNSKRNSNSNIDLLLHFVQQV